MEADRHSKQTTSKQATTSTYSSSSAPVSGESGAGMSSSTSSSSASTSMSQHQAESSSAQPAAARKKATLSASAMSFVPSSSAIDFDSVPSYRPPSQQPYQQFERNSNVNPSMDSKATPFNPPGNAAAQAADNNQKNNKNQNKNENKNQKANKNKQQQPHPSSAAASESSPSAELDFGGQGYRPLTEQPFYKNEQHHQPAASSSKPAPQQQQQGGQRGQQRGGGRGQPPATGSLESLADAVLNDAKAASSQPNQRKSNQRNPRPNANAGASDSNSNEARLRWEENQRLNAALTDVPHPPQQQAQSQQQQQRNQPKGENNSNTNNKNNNVDRNPNQENNEKKSGRGNRNRDGKGPAGSPGPSPSPPPTSASPAPAAATSSSSGSFTSFPQNRSKAAREGHVDNSALAKTITEQLIDGTYDCSICSEPIGRRGKVWSCSQCHIIIHLSCINKWYQTNRAQSLGDTSFRCPGCMFVRTEPPGDYYCFCGKVFEPDYSAFLTPHSCGQVCGKLRNCETHTCNLPCHPGFCAKCTLPGPMTTCGCGATPYRLKCGESEETADKPSCGKICQKPLSCGFHFDNTRTCHSGKCDPCTVIDSLTCFCGKNKKELPCGSSDAILDPTEENPKQKSYTCHTTCDRTLDCGYCKCKDLCHQFACGPCEKQPPKHADEKQSCACGKESHTLAEIQSNAQLSAKWKRQSCRDALPTCASKCGRVLNCGFHTCVLPCHDPDTTPCSSALPNTKILSSSADGSSSSKQPAGCVEVVKRQCRCSAENVVDVPCVRIRGDKSKGIAPASHLDVTCDVRCKAKLKCKKHTCGVVCCPKGESHVCTKVCGKPLDCGKHCCDAFCHLGACKPCGVVYREGIVCACGRTSTAPNTKCGTAAPRCPYPCSRPRKCNPNHKCIQTCHENDCAPCVVLVSKLCAGGHKMLTSIPCYAQPSCGITCNKLLSCGMHNCKKPCHAGKCTVPSGSQVDVKRKGWGISASSVPVEEEKAESEEDAKEEEDDGAIKSCQQKCGLPRGDCGHACAAKCHPSLPCPTNLPCHENVRIYCTCRRLSKIRPCRRGTANSDDDEEEVTELECTAQCEVETRNAKLRAALQLDETRVSIPYPSELLDQVITLDLFDFLVRYEKMLAEFLALTSGTSKTFPPMPNNQRWLIHQLAAYYNLESESFDPEPRRAVRVIKNPTSTLPKMKLSDAIKLYRELKAKGQAPKATVSQNAVIHVWDLDLDPRIVPSDLALALKPYALDATGRPNHNFRINWFDNSRAMIVFHDAQLATNVRAALEKRKLFGFEPDEYASKKAVEAHKSLYAHNSLFRRFTGAAAASLSASRTKKSTFDEWSDSRSASAQMVGTSWDSDRAPPSGSSVPASATVSSSKSYASSTTPSYSSDAMTEDELQAFIARTAISDPIPSSSPPAASTGVSAFVSSGNPTRVSVSSNQWSALNGDEEESDEEDDNAEAGTTRKQRRRAREAAAAAAAGAASGASEDASVDGSWEMVLNSQPIRQLPNRSGSDEPARAKDAFDD